MNYRIDSCSGKAAQRVISEETGLLGATRCEHFHKIRGIDTTMDARARSSTFWSAHPAECSTLGEGL
jgi:hypothetical protein